MDCRVKGNLHKSVPPSDEGGGKTIGFDGGREGAKLHKNATFLSLSLATLDSR